MMNRLRQSGLLLATGLLVAASAARVAAQADGVDIKPTVMLLVDTSGSMERRADCVCPQSSPDCSSCLPQCGGSSTNSTRNRWATVVEALTGSWPTFTCTQQTRPVGAPDANYYIPHYTNPGTTGQTQDGVLDSYIDRVRFGLMTFDNVGTLTTEPTLVPSSRWTAAFLTNSQGALGDYSYGIPQSFWFPGCNAWHTIDNGAHSATAATGPLIPLGSPTTVDMAANNATIQNALLGIRPYGATPIAGMLTDLQYYLANSADVLAPTSATDTGGDPYASCRKRYVILLTDGYPNADMRGQPVYCERQPTTIPTSPYPSDRSSTDSNLCPYDLPEDIAAQLCNPVAGTCTKSSIPGRGVIDGLYVIGFAVEQSSTTTDPVSQRLNTIASNGGTRVALSASNLTDLRTALDNVLTQVAPRASTRTIPAFASATAGTTSNALAKFSTGYKVRTVTSTSPSVYWQGVLERQRIECDSSYTPVAQPVEPRDQFHILLNSQRSRKIFTTLPTSAANVRGYLTATSDLAPLGLTPTTSGSNNGHQGGGGNSCSPRNAGGGGGGNAGGNGGNAGGNAGGNGNGHQPTGPAETGLSQTPTLVTSSISPQYFGLANGDTSTRNTLVDWLYGVNGQRTDNRLADIIHSSPVIVGPPDLNIADESYNAYRQRTEVEGRPTMLYVGTNDGLIHAFVAKDWTATFNVATSNFSYSQGDTIPAGTELWAYLAPMVMPNVNGFRSAHGNGADGTSIVKEVFFRRQQGAGIDGGIYHTVLLTGFGRGGGGYIALDVTNPFTPKFMWQFVTSDIGATMGSPALGQVLVRGSNGTQTNVLIETAIALLPAGSGVDISSTCQDAQIVDGQWTMPIGCPSQGIGTPPANQGTINARDHQKCWDTTGRQLYFVDPATGQLLQQLNDRVFGSPLSGGFSLYTGEVGTIATRAYFTDADGILWRLNISDPSPANWNAVKAVDLFGGLGATQGQPAYYPPAVSTDSDGHVVIIQGTGDLENQNSMAYNRVVSITEIPSYNTDTGAELDVAFPVNWIVTLQGGEMLTGPIELFNGQAYFATFQPPASGSYDQCLMGSSRIWGVDYRQSQTGTQNPVGVLESPVGSGNLVTYIGPYQQQMIMGTKVTQLPSCYDSTTANVTDPYVGTRTVSRFAGRAAPTFQLVANVSGSGGTIQTGATVQQFTRTLTPPVSYTRVQGWAGRAD
ncbi:MAG: PilC/PilY family type IV pilus protein [Polyangiales bacterium]